MSVQYSGDKITFADNSVLGSAWTGFKNRILNGDMRIDQRNAGSSITPTLNEYTLDRWQVQVSVTSKFSVQQNAGSVTPPVGFTNYLGVTSLSAYSLLSGSYFQIGPKIEGFNVADFGWGTANAHPITFSFWVRSSLTGTFGGSLSNGGGTRTYPYTYTISSANTWEYKTVTVAGDTSGTWLTNNGKGLELYFGLGVGSTYSGTAGSWSGSYYISATGATSVVSTNGATFYITGVQLEKGSTATSFDYRPYGVELNLCQRYYWRGWHAHSMNTGSYTSGCIISFPLQYTVPMRTAPTIGQSIAGITYGGTSSFTAIASSNNNTGRVNITTTATTQNAYFVMGASDYVDATAEL